MASHLWLMSFSAVGLYTDWGCDEGILEAQKYILCVNSTVGSQAEAECLFRQQIL